jgi:hypothetical protein
MSWIKIIFLILIFSSLGAALYFRATSKPYIFISIKIFIAAIGQFLVFSLLSKNTQFIFFNLYDIVECVLLMIFYFHIINSRVVRKGIFLYGLLYLIGSAYYLYNKGVAFESFTPFVFVAPPVIFLSLYWFYSKIKLPRSQSLLKLPLFWINTGHLMFYGPSLLGMGMYSYILHFAPEAQSSSLIFTKITNFVLYSSYIIAFTCLPKTQK